MPVAARRACARTVRKPIDSPSSAPPRDQRQHLARPRHVRATSRPSTKRPRRPRGSRSRCRSAPPGRAGTACGCRPAPRRSQRCARRRPARRRRRARSTRRTGWHSRRTRRPASTAQRQPANVCAATPAGALRLVCAGCGERRPCPGQPPDAAGASAGAVRPQLDARPARTRRRGSRRPRPVSIMSPTRSPMAGRARARAPGQLQARAGAAEDQADAPIARSAKRDGRLAPPVRQMIGERDRPTPATRARALRPPMPQGGGERRSCASTPLRSSSHRSLTPSAAIAEHAQGASWRRRPRCRLGPIAHRLALLVVG